MPKAYVTIDTLANFWLYSEARSTGGSPMQLIRSITQTLPNGRLREMSFHRSDNSLYIASLTADPRGDLWSGELGYCTKSEVVKLFKGLQEHLKGNPADLFTLEVQIGFAAHVDRYGASSPMRKEPWADYLTATITVSGRHKIEFMLQDLEGALAWAA